MSVFSINKISLILSSIFISMLAQAYVTVEPKTTQPGQYTKNRGSLVIKAPDLDFDCLYSIDEDQSHLYLLSLWKKFKRCNMAG